MLIKILVEIGILLRIVTVGLILGNLFARNLKVTIAIIALATATLFLVIEGYIYDYDSLISVCCWIAVVVCQTIVFHFQKMEEISRARAREAQARAREAQARVRARLNH